MGDDVSRMDLASNSTEPDQNGIIWDTLSDKEKLVLLAMITSNSEKEAIEKSPVGKTQYFVYKRRLDPIKDQVIDSMLMKAYEVLKGNTMKAAEVLSEQLDSPKDSVRYKAAKSILDRVVGRPRQTQQVHQTAKMQNFYLIGVDQKKIDKLFEPQT